MQKLQSQIKSFVAENGMESPIEHRLMDTVSELGEVAKEILKSSKYGRQPAEYSDELKSELGDVVYSLITVANTYDIDLEDAVQGVLEKYARRLKKGSAGSENDPVL